MRAALDSVFSANRSPVRLLGWTTFFIPLLVYTWTLAPTVTLEDSAEYAAAARVFGLAHPPGAPTWTMIGGIAARIPLGPVAFRTNILSALCGAGAAFFLFHWLTRSGIGPLTAWAGALAASFSRCIWGQSVVTEVYAMNLLALFLCFFLAARWRETGDAKWLWGTAFAGGIGAGVHHLLILLSPLVIGWAMWERWKTLLNPKVACGSIIALLLGFSVYLYLPLRDSAPIAWEKVDSFSAFISYFNREMYKEAEGGVWTQGTFADGIRFFLAFFTNLPREVGGLLVLFSIPGMMWLWMNRRDMAWVLGGVLAINVPILLLLAGTATFTPTSEFINRFYYLPATAAVAVMAVMGWRHSLDAASRRFGFKPSAWIRAAFVGFAPLLVLGLNWSACDRSDYRIADEYARNILRSLEPGDAVFPLTNNESFLLLYFHHVAEDRRAFLLDERFGWDGKTPPRRVYTAWDVGASSVNPLTEIFGGRETVPETLLYRLLDTSPGEGLQACRFMREVDLRIRQAPGDFPNLTPFERMIFASYSAYYARLGGNRRLVGETANAEALWRRAEELNPPDAYCFYLLGTLYEAAGKEGADRLNKQALDVFPLSYDPLDTRFYSVTRKMIEEKAGPLHDE